MAKTKASLNLIGALGTFLTGRLLTNKNKQELGSTTVSMMLDLISKGQSPVKGEGRFVGYAADRKASAAKEHQQNLTMNSKIARRVANTIRGSSRFYPNSIMKRFPGKKRRPVNLSVNGKFLSTIGWEPSGKNGVNVGHLKPNEKIGKSATVKDLFATHNLGDHPFVPQRKYLPIPDGEFVISITRKIREIIQSRIKDLIRQGN